MSAGSGWVPLALAGVALVAAGALGWLLLTRNRLVRQRNQVLASWAQVEVQLQRRQELVPQLVQTVRGYAGHERASLAALVTARTGARYVSAAGAAERAGPEQVLGRALGRMFAVTEGYPQLRADAHFDALHRELAATEDRLAHARQFYNSAVRTLTDTIQSAPSNLVARGFGFRPPAYFQADVDLTAGRSAAAAAPAPTRRSDRPPR